MNEELIIFAGCFLSASAGWLGCYFWRRGLERQSADNAWRMANTFHAYKGRENLP